MNKSGRTLLILAAASIAAHSRCLGQNAFDTTSLSRLPQPLAGGLSVETTVQAAINPAYYDAAGRSDELARSLDLYQATQTISYGLSNHLGIGAIAEYRDNRLCCIASSWVSNSGLAGGGVFFDWGFRPASNSGENRLRLGYEIVRGPDESNLLPVSDGQDRIFAQSTWALLGRGADAPRLGMNIDAEYGRPFEKQKTFFRGYPALAPSVPIVRSTALSLDAMATIGLVLSTDARENGTLFHNRRSTQRRAGGEFRIGFGKHLKNQLAIGATGDFASRNALGCPRISIQFIRQWNTR